MRIKLLIKNFLSKLYVMSKQIDITLDKSLRDNKALILMYHRIVVPDQSSMYIEPGMYVEPSTFNKHLEYLKKKYHVLYLSELPYIIQGLRKYSDKPLCFLTFDDGWYDFYYYAFPLLKKYNLPATVFLPTSFIGTNKIFWTDRLSSIFAVLKNTDSDIKKCGISNNDYVNNLECIRGTLETRIHLAIKILKKLRIEKIHEILNELELRHDCKSLNEKRVFLVWDEIQEMKNSGLIEFGGHTANHLILTTLKKDEVIKELKLCMDTLISKKIVNHSFIPFCYPNGNYNNEIAKLVEECGFNLAVITKKGHISLSDNFYMLKRVGVHEDISSSMSLFACYTSGIF